MTNLEIETTPVVGSSGDVYESITVADENLGQTEAIVPGEVTVGEQGE